MPQVETADTLVYLDDARMTPPWEALTALNVPLIPPPTRIARGCNVRVNGSGVSNQRERTVALAPESSSAAEQYRSASTATWKRMFTSPERDQGDLPHVHNCSD
jgi:hypothetical protein